MEEVKGRKEAREAIVAEKQKHLDDIQMHLAALKEAAEPLSMQLALPPEYSLHHQQNLELASLLPMPLYIIFCQLRAVAEIAWTGTLEVLIAGELPFLALTIVFNIDISREPVCDWIVSNYRTRFH